MSSHEPHGPVSMFGFVGHFRSDSHVFLQPYRIQFIPYTAPTGAGLSELRILVVPSLRRSVASKYSLSGTFSLNFCALPKEDLNMKYRLGSRGSDNFHS